MKQSAPDHLPPWRYPLDPWRLVERQFDPTDIGTTETLFAVANGYLGLRANPEEGRDAAQHGTYINGFHETWEIQHAEDAYGFATTGQTIVNAPDAKVIKLYVDDEPLLLTTAELDHYERVLDMRTGTLTRELIWRTPGGKRVQVRSQRLVSLVHRHLAVLTFEVTMLDGAAPVVISSQLINRQDGEDEYHVAAHALGKMADPRKMRRFGHRVLRPQYHHASEAELMLGYRCANSGMTLGHQRLPSRRDARHLHRRFVGHRRPGEVGVQRPAASGRTSPDRQARQLSHLDRGARRRVGRSLPTHAGPGRGRGSVVDRRGADRVAGRLLGRCRCGVGR